MTAPFEWWDLVYEAGVSPEVFDPAEGVSLDEVTLRGLLRCGVSIDAIVSPWSVRRASVCFLPGCDRYFPLAVGENALIFPIFDSDGVLVDFAACLPEENRIGVRFGAASIIGQDLIGRDRQGRVDRPLTVFRSPITYLQFNRRGLVIADWDAAPHVLADVAVYPEDEDHADELERRLRVRPPIIVRRRRSA